MYFTKRQMLKPLSRATRPSTIATNSTHVSQKHAMSAPSCASVRTPNDPIVNAIAPNAPMGASRVM